MISGKRLSELLDVAPATLSQAVTNGHFCRGYDVGSWAVLSPSDRVIGYDVPASVLGDLGASGEALRPNPEPTLPNVAPVPVEPAPVATAPGDYFRPAAAGGAALVLSKAIEHDNPAGRATVAVGAGLIGSLAGYELGQKSGGAALVGFVACAGLAAWVMGLISLPNGQEARQGGDRENRLQGGFYDTTLPAAHGVTFGGDGAGIARNFGPVVAVPKHSWRV